MFLAQSLGHGCVSLILGLFPGLFLLTLILVGLGIISSFLLVQFFLFLSGFFLRSLVLEGFFLSGFVLRGFFFGLFLLFLKRLTLTFSGFLLFLVFFFFLFERNLGIAQAVVRLGFGRGPVWCRLGERFGLGLRLGWPWR